MQNRYVWHGVDVQRQKNSYQRVQHGSFTEVYTVYGPIHIRTYLVR